MPLLSSPRKMLNRSTDLLLSMRKEGNRKTDGPAVQRHVTRESRCCCHCCCACDVHERGQVVLLPSSHPRLLSLPWASPMVSDCILLSMAAPCPHRSGLPAPGTGTSSWAGRRGANRHPQQDQIHDASANPGPPFCTDRNTTRARPEQKQKQNTHTHTHTSWMEHRVQTGRTDHAAGGGGADGISPARQEWFSSGRGPVRPSARPHTSHTDQRGGRRKGKREAAVASTLRHFSLRGAARRTHVHGGGRGEVSSVLLSCFRHAVDDG